MICIYCKNHCKSLNASDWECNKHNNRLITYYFERPDKFNRVLVSIFIKFIYKNEDFSFKWYFNNYENNKFEVRKIKQLSNEVIFTLSSHPKNLTLDNLTERLDMWLLLS